MLVLIEDMETSLDEVLLSSIVEACLKTQRIDLPKELIRKWEGKGVALQFTAPAYGCMVKAFGLGGVLKEFDAAGDESMQSAAIRNDTRVYG